MLSFMMRSASKTCYSLTLQLELNLERLRMAVDDLLIKLAKIFPKTKLQIVFLINNYDMTISVLKVSISISFCTGK